MNAKQAREERAEVLKQLGELVNKAKSEQRSLNTDEREQFDRMDCSAKELLDKAEGYERIELYDGLTLNEARQEVRQAQKPRFTTNAVEERNNAYLGWLLHGTNRSKREYWHAAERQGIEIANPNLHFDWGETRAQATSPGSAGGYTVAVDNSLMSSVEVALKAYGGVRKVANVIRTSTGAPLPYALSDDTSNLAEEVAENGSIGSTDMSFSQNVLNAYKYDSAFIKVSWEMLNDSAVNLVQLIGQQAGTRIGRKQNAHFTTGTGAGQPQGIVTAATLGATAASATAIAYADLLTLLHSVDPEYRASPGCGWMFSDNVLFNLRGILDLNLRPLLNSSLDGIGNQVGGNSLFGYPFTVNQQMASVTASQKTILFGDLNKYIVRDVDGEGGGFNIVRLNEAYAASGQVAFLAWTRADGMLSDAGTHPVKYMIQHS